MTVHEWSTNKRITGGHSCIRGRIRGRLLSVTCAEPAADVSAWEREIDRLAYALYGLSPAGMITEEEIVVVEGGNHAGLAAACELRKACAPVIFVI